MSETDAMRRFQGGLLLALGGLIAALTGLCTLVVGFPVLAGAFRGQGGDSLLFLLIPVIVGGLPCWGGVAIALLGWKRLRGTDR